MSGTVPGFGGVGETPSNEPTRCPLCNAAVVGGDGLQVHYLTSCSGYDKVDDQPRPKPKKVTREDPVGSSSSSDIPFSKPLPSSGGGARATNSAVAGSVVSTQSGMSVIQFMWQPLTEITYPEITLLASFKSGRVQLSLDSGGHYESGRVTIPNGTYEGQLVIGDSFVYPVKKFTVSKTDDIVVLQFDVTQGVGNQGDTSYKSPSSSSHYGTGYMQQNSSYNYSRDDSSYSNEGKTGHGGLTGGYTGYEPRDDLGGYTGITNSPRAGGDDGFSYYKGYSRTTNSAPPVHSTTQYTHQATPTPASVHSSVAENQSYSGTSELATRTLAGGVSSEKTRPTPAGLPDNVQSSRLNRGATYPLIGGRKGSERLNVSPSPSVSDTHHNKLTASPAIATQASSQGGRDDPATEFNVGQLQQVPFNQITDIETLRQRLEEVITERDDLKRNQERVNARWDGRVKRLEAQLQKATGGNLSTEDNTLVVALQEAQEQVTRLERELDALRGQQSETTATSVDSSGLESHLDEMKDRNTALEQQLVEYAGTISDQTKYIQSTVAGSKAQDAEALKNQQDLIHLTSFVKKQQLEYAEGIAGLKKQISSLDGIDQLKQMNVSLTGELEDYRVQTRRLLEDLHKKEEEIGRLKEALLERGPHSSDKAQLEIATMQEKLTAWQEEFEKVAPLRDEVEQLQEHISQQDQELRRLAGDNDDLTRQIQSLINEREKRESEFQRKATDYDTLMGRLTDLQQTRVSLENELQPLREERASILRENALLREGSDPQNYAKLKTEYESIAAHCQTLEDRLSEQEALLSAHKDTNFEMQTKLNQATDPERLNSIRTRMDRYKQERDSARVQTDELSTRLDVLETEKQEALEQLQETTEQSDRILSEYQNSHDEQISKLESKIHRYREERNKYKKHCSELEKQVDEWRDLVSHGKAKQATPNFSVEYEQTDDSGSSFSPTLRETHEEQSSPPHTEYHPQAYTGGQYHQYRDPEGPSMGEGNRGIAQEQSPQPRPRKRTSSNSHGGRTTAKPDSPYYEMVDVKTKEGTKVIYVQKYQGELNVKTKPKVIVKRGGEYEQGTLMFVGMVNGKELAGIHMDCRVTSSKTSSAGGTSSHDGTCKQDGKRYFKCPIGYGLYVPVSKVYLEMDHAYV